ncbi:MAG: hypothetical protein IJL54_00510 [Prevotella sp.]|nr:hypothetical protein [Prevotella sp.]
MSHKRSQNIIAESRIALPLTIVYGLVMSILYGAWEQQLWMQTIILAISTLLMAELNNSNSLIRIFSRMVSCSFLFMSVMAIFLLHSLQATIVQLCLIAFYLSFFKAYQNAYATGWVFYAFFAIGMASVVFVQILYFVPILWILMIFNILAFGARSFVASLLGLITPYWFIGGYMIYRQQYDTLFNHFPSLTQFSTPFDYSSITQHQMVTFGWVVFLFLVGTIHYLCKRYADKIRTRMLYEVFITVGICCIIFAVLQPHHYTILLSMLIVNTAPLIGHFIATTQTRFTNFSFHVIVIVTLFITYYNIWMPSLKF